MAREQAERAWSLVKRSFLWDQRRQAMRALRRVGAQLRPDFEVLRVNSGVSSHFECVLVHFDAFLERFVKVSGPKRPLRSCFGMGFQKFTTFEQNVVAMTAWHEPPMTSNSL